MDTSARNGMTTSIVSVFMGMSLNDIAQLMAFGIAIVSGLMAIRHYYSSTKLNNLRIKKLEEQDDEHKKDCD